MTTNEIMVLIDEYAATAGMTLVEPCLARAQADKEARAAVLAAVTEMSRDAERYRWLRLQHWTDGTVCVIKAKDIQLGTMTYSDYLLDEVMNAALGIMK